MELIKRNIHMDRVKRSTVIQFTMEEDLNLPEDKPDISTLNLEKGEVVIEEIRPGTDEVTVRGKLGYAILYHTQETGSNLVLLSGALPFEEKIHIAVRYCSGEWNRRRFHGKYDQFPEAESAGIAASHGPDRRDLR